MRQICESSGSKTSPCFTRKKVSLARSPLMQSCDSNVLVADARAYPTLHATPENFAEAGVCYTHIATLVAEYLVSTEKIGMNPTAFRSIFPGISESVAVRLVEYFRPY